MNDLRQPYLQGRNYWWLAVVGFLLVVVQSFVVLESNGMMDEVLPQVLVFLLACLSIGRGRRHHKILPFVIILVELMMDLNDPWGSYWLGVIGAILLAVAAFGYRDPVHPSPLPKLEAV